MTQSVGWNWSCSMRWSNQFASLSSKESLFFFFKQTLAVRYDILSLRMWTLKHPALDLGPSGRLNGWPRGRRDGAPVAVMTHCSHRLASFGTEAQTLQDYCPSPYDQYRYFPWQCSCLPCIFFHIWLAVVKCGICRSWTGWSSHSTQLFFTGEPTQCNSRLIVGKLKARWAEALSHNVLQRCIMCWVMPHCAVQGNLLRCVVCVQTICVCVCVNMCIWVLFTDQGTAAYDDKNDKSVNEKVFEKWGKDGNVCRNKKRTEGISNECQIG